MTGREGAAFGVFFTTNETQIDIDEVKKNFRKYGRIAYVTQIMKRVYVNFTTKEEAENCLSDSPDPTYGEVKRGKFGSCEAPNSKEMNHQNGYKRTGTYTFKMTDRNEKKMNSSRISESESDEMSVRSNGRCSLDDPYSRESQIISKSHSLPWHRASERKSVPYESKHDSSDGPPPLLSANVGPPPLQSFDNGPPPLLPLYSELPPLISVEETDHPMSARSSLNGTTQRPPLLPTPPLYMHRNFNPELNNLPSSHHVSCPTSVHDASEVPPPLLSAISQPLKESQECTQSSTISSFLSYEDYVKKYGNYVLIINIPQDITADEVEKILYPHIPVCVSEPEVTNIRMRLLFCLVTFNTKTEATKAAKQLDGVEIRGQCLSMIRLDELVLFSDVPF